MSDEEEQSGGKKERNNNFFEKRSHERHQVPAVYQRYITLRVKARGAFGPAVLLNFSRYGIMFESAAPLDPDTRADCIISLSQLLSKEISFGIHVKYCQKKENSFIVGAAIDTVADAIWFNVFIEVHDFIVQRQGDVY